MRATGETTSIENAAAVLLGLYPSPLRTAERRRFSALVGQLITLSQAANVLLPEVAVGMPCTFGEDDIRLALTIFASFSVYGKLW
ncbi:hypothetical protein M8C21_008864, partial [Ambrosia artemisiifolia]